MKRTNARRPRPVVAEPEPADLDRLIANAAAAGAAEPSNGKSAAREVFLWLRQIARDPDLTPLGYRVAIELSQHVDRWKGYAHPSLQKVADDLDVTRRGVQLVVRQLQDHGHLDVVFSRGSGHANRYRLKLYPGKRGAA